jgi:hypothetical protein
MEQASIDVPGPGTCKPYTLQYIVWWVICSWWGQLDVKPVSFGRGGLGMVSFEAQERPFQWFQAI